ncbi:MAG: family 10 glycosylhydrolase [Blastochloris sp.]|nr:family 10 glycosylhydrolase [Blastochloris sp.]
MFLSLSIRNFYALSALTLLTFSLDGSEVATSKPLAREFRGAWVATVYNLDWPSKPGLPVEEQKRELRVLLDRAKNLGLNAIVFQVRPSCDALYASPYEPWSPYLTGKMGEAPQPFYDPLEYAVTQAHARCLELHAWINPYRARTGKDFVPSRGHITKTNPSWIRTYTSQEWLDPGLPEVREHVLKVVRDIVRRYDIDGLHIDDYFYPYPKVKNGKRLEFPDGKTYQAYRTRGGLLGKSDWRRDNVNQMVQSIHQVVREEKPWVKFGVSPFGIWKPGVPKGTMANVDAREDLHADSRLWLQEGWLDYCAPQLYWSRDSPEQAFDPLLTWWALQNTKGRHLWPGIATERVGVKRRPEEMVAQVMLMRLRLQSQGHIHWNFKPLLTDQLGVGTLLKKKVYTEIALVPESPWMVPTQLGRPTFLLKSETSQKEWSLSWSLPPNSAPPALWILRRKRSGTYVTELLPARMRSVSFEDTSLAEVSLTAVDRYGRLSAEQKSLRPPRAEKVAHQ